MTVSQADKAKKFRALHEAPGSFVIPNPWDGGSARVLAGLGFEALAMDGCHSLVLELVDEVGFLAPPDGQVLVGDDRVSAGGGLTHARDRAAGFHGCGCAFQA